MHRSAFHRLCSLTSWPHSLVHSYALNESPHVSVTDILIFSSHGDRGLLSDGALILITWSGEYCPYTRNSTSMVPIRVTSSFTCTHNEMACMNSKYGATQYDLLSDGSSMIILIHTFLRLLWSCWNQRTVWLVIAAVNAQWRPLCVMPCLLRILSIAFAFIAWYFLTWHSKIQEG